MNPEESDKALEKALGSLRPVRPSDALADRIGQAVAEEKRAHRSWNPGSVRRVIFLAGSLSVGAAAAVMLVFGVLTQTQSPAIDPAEAPGVAEVDTGSDAVESVERAAPSVGATGEVLAAESMAHTNELFAEVPLDPTQENLNTGPLKPIRARHELRTAEDLGTVHLADGTAVRRLRYDFLDTIVYRHDEDGSILEVSYPREEFLTVPVAAL